MTIKNLICPYLAINCGDETRIYDDSLCSGEEGSFRNCGTYPILTSRLDLIKEQIAKGTPEKKRDTLAVLIENPEQIN